MTEKRSKHTRTNLEELAASLKIVNRIHLRACAVTNVSGMAVLVDERRGSIHTFSRRYFMLAMTVAVRMGSDSWLSALWNIFAANSMLSKSKYNQRFNTKTVFQRLMYRPVASWPSSSA